VPDDRTTVTELATALGTLGASDMPVALARRPDELDISEATWQQLDARHASGRFDAEFATAYANGRAFLEAEDALRGRRPRLIEWTGGRRPPGDEVAPVDLRIDHVFLVSCKYLSRNIANPSPARLFDGLLATTGEWGQTDWYEVVAPVELHALYDACRRATGLTDLPDHPAALTRPRRARPTGNCARASARCPPSAGRPTWSAPARRSGWCGGCCGSATPHTSSSGPTPAARCACGWRARGTGASPTVSWTSPSVRRPRVNPR
jgi:hypothetical protein